jgi:PAS domain S-box-containing protein
MVAQQKLRTPGPRLLFAGCAEMAASILSNSPPSATREKSREAVEPVNLEMSGRSLATDGAASAEMLAPELAAERFDFARFGRRLFASAIRPYGTAVLLVGAAFVATLLIRGLFPYPFLFLFFAAVMASAWFGGTGAGLFAVLLSTIVVDYFFVPPYDSFAVNVTDGSFFVAFIFCSLAASWVSASKKKSEEALREARDELGIRVSERTAELQASNAELRQRERQLRLLTEVIPQQIWSGTPDGTIDYCNHRLLEYVGCSLEEVQGGRFMETIHPDDREEFHQAFRRALSGGASFEGQWRVRNRDGCYRLFFMRGVPLRQAEGKPLRWYGTNTDIEDHKNAEQALLHAHAELAHLSRVLTMGELTTSIAHEINQPLTAVVAHGHACVEWLSAVTPNVLEAKRSAERIIQDGTRAGAVIGRIRSLFKKEIPAKDVLHMNEVIQELTVFLRDEAVSNKIVLRTELDPELPAVTGDRVQLQQVVLNLIVNGIDALRAKTDGLREIVVRSAREGTGIVIAVEDSGPGFGEGAGEKIFHPFFTTKPQGIGMGLSISRSIVESHAGRLWALPRAAGGAVFKFTVPSRN